MINATKTDHFLKRVPSYSLSHSTGPALRTTEKLAELGPQLSPGVGNS